MGNFSDLNTEIKPLDQLQCDVPEALKVTLSDKAFPLTQETVVGIDACAALKSQQTFLTNQPTFTQG